MSLDLANKQGRAHNAAPYDVDGTVETDLSNVDNTTFDSGDLAGAVDLLLQVEMSGNDDIDAATFPISIIEGGTEVLVDGSQLTLVKADTGGGKITFTCPVLGITFSYVNKQGESITLRYDTSTGTGRWVAQI